MAEVIFNALVEDTGLPFRAHSAGVSALSDRHMSSNASAALEEVGVHAEGHIAKQVSETVLKEADLVLTMSPQHVAEIRRLFGTPPHKIYTLPEYTDGAASGQKEVSDPYGHTMATYRASVRQLLDHLDILLTRLRSEQWT